MSTLNNLTTAIQAVCPVDGVAAGPNVPKNQWEIWFKDESSIEQKAAAQAIIDNWDWAAEELALQAAEEDARILAGNYENDTDRKDMFNRLMTATPAQIDTWLTNNVTNLNQARAVLGIVLKLLAVLIRKVT